MLRFFYYIFTIFLVSTLAGFSQPINLVYNGSFEKFEKCPDGYQTQDYKQNVLGWNSPNKGTPDYFNVCSEKSGVPVNWVGNAEANDGEAYMGLIACMFQIDPHQIAYREYISSELTQPLDSGETYYASMHVQHGLSCNIACNGLGMHFSAQNINSIQTTNFPVKPDVFLDGDPIIDIVDDWAKVCGTFVASGGEQHLIIGNFLSNQAMKYYALDENYIQTMHISPMAYYYIDNVEVFKVDSSFNASCNNLKTDSIVAFSGVIPRNGTLLLSNLYFKSDEAIILPESYNELDVLALALKRKANTRISINGHTDNTGDEAHNQALSLDRANAVKRHLLGKGVSRFAIVVNGYGNTKPIADNATEEGRQMNRRVEIEVLN